MYSHKNKETREKDANKSALFCGYTLNMYHN
jgi:hypothetical protein